MPVMLVRESVPQRSLEVHEKTRPQMIRGNELRSL